MKIIYILILSFLFSAAEAQTWSWAKSVSSNGPDKGNSITYDDAGNIYVAADFYTNFGPIVIADSTITDNALIKYSKTGTIIWALNVNGSVTDITTDASGNIYLTGLFENTAQFGDSVFTSLGQADVFVAKVNPAGKFIWAKHAGGTGYDDCYAIAVGTDSNLVIAAFPGSSIIIDDTTINLGGGVLLIDYNLNGNFIWAKQEGYNNRAFGIAIDSDNNILVAGYFSFSSDFGGGTIIPGNGNYSAAFIAKYNSTGGFVWAKTGISAGDNSAQGLVLDNMNNAYITGYFEDTIDLGNNINLISNTSMKDIFIAKYNSSGQTQWANRDGTWDIDIANSIALQGNHVFITGFMGIDYPAINDVFVKAYDLNGNYVMSVRIDSTDNNSANAIAADDDGNVYITGQFQNTLEFNNTLSLTSYASNDYDFFVAKLIPVYSPQDILQLNDKYCISIYPNPATDNISIVLSEDIKDYQISLINALGQTMLQTQSTKVDVSSIPDGLYFLSIKSDQGEFNKRVIICR